MFGLQEKRKKGFPTVGGYLDPQERMPSKRMVKAESRKASIGIEFKINDSFPEENSRSKLQAESSIMLIVCTPTADNDVRGIEKGLKRHLVQRRARIMATTTVRCILLPSILLT